MEGIFMETKTKEKIIDALEDKKILECPICNKNWGEYSGNYDELCDKHYLEIEPTN